MSLTCGYSSPRSDGHANSQVTGTRVQVPLGHEPFGHGAMLPVLRLTRPRRADRRLCPLRTAAPVDRAPRTERLVLAHTVGGLRCHRGYLPADMGTKVMLAAARWLLFCLSGRARLGRARLPQAGRRCWIGSRGANRLVLTTCRDVLT
jgi:hypothetical protein